MVVAGLGVFYPDGTPTQRVGVKIDVQVNLPSPVFAPSETKYWSEQ